MTRNIYKMAGINIVDKKWIFMWMCVQKQAMEDKPVRIRIRIPLFIPQWGNF